MNLNKRHSKMLQWLNGEFLRRENGGCTLIPIFSRLQDGLNSLFKERLTFWIIFLAFLKYIFIILLRR